MKPKIYIDGKEGTTGLQIYERLGGRDDIELLLIDEDKRKDIEERRKFLNAADIAFLCLPDAAADSTVTFSDGTQLLYSPVLSERSDTPTWVWLFAPDVTDDALNDTASYTVTEGKGPVLTAGDVNADGVINAQDALNIRTACAASTVPETQLLLTMDVDLNGRVDAQDVRALADSFVQNTALPTAQEDGQ